MTKRKYDNKVSVAVIESKVTMNDNSTRYAVVHIEVASDVNDASVLKLHEINKDVLRRRLDGVDTIEVLPFIPDTVSEKCIVHCTATLTHLGRSDHK